MQGSMLSSARAIALTLVAMLVTSAGALSAQLPPPYLMDLRLCNGGEIGVAAVMTYGPRQGNPRHTAQGWYYVAPGACETLPHGVYTRYFSLAFKVDGTAQSLTLEENRGIELTKNSRHFIGPDELGTANGWTCVPDDFSSGFNTRFDTWEFDGACDDGFVRFPVSSDFNLTFPVDYTRVSIRISPSLADANRLDRTSVARGDGTAYAGTAKDGWVHGYGAYQWSDGDRYEGEFRDGDRHGFGVLIRANGNRCEGEWRASRLIGTGVGRERGVEKPCYPYEAGFTFESPAGAAREPGSPPEPIERASGGSEAEPTPLPARDDETPGVAEAGSSATGDDDVADAAAQGPTPMQQLGEIAVLFPALALGYFLMTRLALLLVGLVRRLSGPREKWAALRWIHGLGFAAALVFSLISAPMVEGVNFSVAVLLLLGPVLLVRAFDARRYRGGRQTDAEPSAA